MPHNVTNSERGVSSCHQKWLIKYGLGVSGWDTSPALQKGSLWHDLLEHVAVKKRLGSKDMRSDAKSFIISAYERAQSMEEYSDDIVQLIEQMWDGYVKMYALPNESDPFIEWNITHVENSIETVATAMWGAKTIRANVSGKVDKLASMPGGDTGDVWLIEHKSSSLDPNSWIGQHEYSPQGMFYAWMVQNTMPHRVKGIVYDLARTKARKPVEDLLTVKGKVKTYSFSRLPMTTSDIYIKACKIAEPNHGMPSSYETVLQALKNREVDGYWYKRFKVRFRQEEIQRAGQEMAVLASRLTRLWGHSTSWRVKIREAAKRGPHAFAANVSNALRDIGYLYPRNHAECVGRYGPCQYMELCRSYSPEAASSFTLRQIRDHEGV